MRRRRQLWVSVAAVWVWLAPASHAAVAGTVVSAGFAGPFGNLIVVEQALDLRTHDAHLTASLAVRNGDGVSARQGFGRRGSSGLSEGPHLDFAVLRGSPPIEPQSVLPSR